MLLHLKQASVCIVSIRLQDEHFTFATKCDFWQPANLTHRHVLGQGFWTVQAPWLGSDVLHRKRSTCLISWRNGIKHFFCCVGLLHLNLQQQWFCCNLNDNHQISLCFVCLFSSRMMLKLFNFNDSLHFLCALYFHKCRIFKVLRKLPFYTVKKPVFNEWYYEFIQHLDIAIFLSLISD